MENFSTFDVVSDASDHHFVNSNHRGKGFQDKVAKNIMQEWKIMQEGLPESIFVRVYEDRIDLLRAAIIGPSGTPYYNGLFFFDFCFPIDYPARPPTVYYHSFGLNLNPNLYDNGYVCLSLLNTWFGWKKEKWNNNGSTVLQILLSLQALVLNNKPFFNEPGTGFLKFLGIENISLFYNEEAWVKTCKTMLYVLLKPPTHFKELVTTHFREKAPAILLACQSYMNGDVPVGHDAKDTRSSSSNYTVSTRFTTSMNTLLPQLLAQFARNGASVDDFKRECLQLLKHQTTVKKRGVAKPISVLCCIILLVLLFWPLARLW